MYNCIIFDVDGTLIDTEDAVFSTYGKVFFEEFGKKFTKEEMKIVYGVPTSEALVRLGCKDVNETGRKYQKYLMEAFQKVELFQGIPEILDALTGKGIKMGVVTSRNKREVQDDACMQKVKKYFKHIVCADDTEKHKPDPEPLLKQIEQVGSNSANALYIGDTYYDYLCARSAGVDFALALWGAQNTGGIEADYDLKAPSEILEII